MTKANLENAATVFLLAERDLEAAKLLSFDEAQHQNRGLHLQQASEKLIKTMIYLSGGKFDFRKGYMMGYLREQLELAGGEAIDARFDELDALQIFAVEGRYFSKKLDRKPKKLKAVCRLRRK